MHFLRHRLGLDAEEAAAVGWSWLFFFCVLSAYYVIRPIRDDMGVAGGVNNLPWLFTASLVGMLAANPPFAWAVARFPRARFVSLAYRFFAFNLILFFVALRTAPHDAQIWVGRVFFVWTSVFNMFVVSIFWSVVADVFAPEQAKRLFGLIAAGGTVGAISGSAITSTLVAVVGAANLLLVSVVLLEVAAFSARRLFHFAGAAVASRPVRVQEEERIGGSVWEGLKRSFTTAYFVNISLHMLLFTVLTTFLYFQQATLVDGAIADRAARTQFFATIDLAVNSSELLTQLFVTGWFVRTFGLVVALSFLPAVSAIGFAWLGLSPTIWTLMVFQVVRRSGNFSIARPAREVLFTVVPPMDRYKTKTAIDTLIYRAGDQIGAWMYAPMAAMGLGVPGISAVAVVLSVASVANAVYLGRRQQERAAAQDAAAMAVA